ncbi:MAG: hypothetical protein O7I93_10095 [Gemmatimonadetes bacterium]|nr:hypothetical protein [Gemmatimonadota bacterium]
MKRWLVLLALLGCVAADEVLTPLPDPTLVVAYDSTDAVAHWFSAEVTDWRQGVTFTWVVTLCETALETCTDPFSSRTEMIPRQHVGVLISTLNDVVGLALYCSTAQAAGGEAFVVFAAALPKSEPEQAEHKVC